MYLESLSFIKKPINGSGWEINNCNFNKVNLVAGQNASGKTRLLKAIDTLVNILLDNNKKVIAKFYFNWEIILKEKDNVYIYRLEIKDTTVVYEKLLINNEEYFSRDISGKGQIKYESKKNLKLDFEIEKDKIAIESKRDKKQHPSLELIFNWINSVYMYNFGGTLGRNTFIAPKTNIDEDNISNEISKNDKAVVFKFEKGLEKYKQKFKDDIIKDFNSIGYSIVDIDTTRNNELFKKLEDSEFPIPSILHIKEKNIDDKIYQQEISQGMFRVLSLIIQIKYLEYELDEGTTILIDDIGEGLDFERANNLIKYLIKNIEQFKDKIQLIMTTNDRLVMNNVPLEHWIIVDKDNNGKINFYSEKTHPENFENFEDVGLNNFNFFSGEYYKNCAWDD